MRTRAQRLRLLAMGGALSMFCSGGMFAATFDFVESRGNATRSPVYTLGRHDLRIALVGKTTSCPPMIVNGAPNSAYKEDYSLGAYTTADLGADGTSFGQQALCLANFTSNPGRVLVNFAHVVQTEVTCESDEEASPTDSCTAGNVQSDPGELASALRASFTGEGNRGGVPCNGNSDVVAAYDGHHHTVQESLVPGTPCRMYLDLALPPDTASSILTDVQTDRIQWDIDFVLADPATQDQSSTLNPPPNGTTNDSSQHP